MGEEHVYRYVNTTSVPNSNTTTHTVTQAEYDSTSSIDLGSTNTIRYISIPDSLKSSGDIKHTAIHSSTLTASGTLDKDYILLILAGNSFSSSKAVLKINDTAITKVTATSGIAIFYGSIYSKDSSYYYHAGATSNSDWKCALFGFYLE